MTRHIYKHGKKYEIRKAHNGKIYSFGEYSTIEQAQLIRDTLEFAMKKDKFDVNAFDSPYL